VTQGRLRIDSTEKSQWRSLTPTGELFAIVDSCDEPSVPPKVQALGPEKAVSLYRGGAEEQYSTVAPYLFQVDQPTFEWIATDLWNSPWGIFVRAPASLESLRQHFRQFLTVKSTDAKPYLFRFYDPRILPPFLEKCTPGELAGFFGPVTGFGAKQTAESVILLRLPSRDR
jgi:hypothetical protein